MNHDSWKKMKSLPKENRKNINETEKNKTRGKTASESRTNILKKKI